MAPRTKPAPEVEERYQPGSDDLMDIGDAAVLRVVEDTSLYAARLRGQITYYTARHEKSGDRFDSSNARRYAELLAEI